MKEYEVNLARYCDPFWKAVWRLREALKAKESAESLQEEYSQRKTELVKFLDCQRTDSGVFGVTSTIPEWVGPIRGRIAATDADLAKLQERQSHCPELSAVLRPNSALG